MFQEGPVETDLRQCACAPGSVRRASPGMPWIRRPSSRLIRPAMARLRPSEPEYRLESLAHKIVRPGCGANEASPWNRILPFCWQQAQQRLA